MKRVAAALITAIIMTLMTWTALSQPRFPRIATKVAEADFGSQDSTLPATARFEGATSCIEGLLVSARAGDVASYLAAFGGPLRDRLAREADEIGRDIFALQLRRASQARKSHAIFTPESEGGSGDGARIVVESTFADRIERQTFRLEHAPNGWLITETETAREHVPKTPFGSLAKYQEPEGPPVNTVDDESGSEEIAN
jgi:hypothetical protein